MYLGFTERFFYVKKILQNPDGMERKKDNCFFILHLLVFNDLDIADKIFFCFPVTVCMSK